MDILYGLIISYLHICQSGFLRQKVGAVGITTALVVYSELLAAEENSIVRAVKFLAISEIKLPVIMLLGTIHDVSIKQLFLVYFI